MGQVIKIKAFSWFLAVAYLGWGVLAFGFVSSFRAMFLDFGESLPILTRTVLFIGPVGWLVLAVLGAVIIVLNDLKHRFPLLNPFLGVALILTILVIFFAMICPMVGGMQDYIPSPATNENAR